MKKARYIVFTIVMILMVFPFIKKVRSEKINKVDYIYVTVTQGDTVWKIAKNNNFTKKDIRKLVYEIRKANDLESLIIHPGQVIKVPLE